MSDFDLYSDNFNTFTILESVEKDVRVAGNKAGSVGKSGLICDSCDKVFSCRRELQNLCFKQLRENRTFSFISVGLYKNSSHLRYAYFQAT
jgi:hypothetical protein